MIAAGWDLVLTDGHGHRLGVMARATCHRAARHARRTRALFIGVPRRHIKVRLHWGRLRSVLIEPTFEDEARWKRMEDR